MTQEDLNNMPKIKVHLKIHGNKKKKNMNRTSTEAKVKEDNKNLIQKLIPKRTQLRLKTQLLRLYLSKSQLYSLKTS